MSIEPFLQQKAFTMTDNFQLNVNAFKGQGYTIDGAKFCFTCALSQKGGTYVYENEIEELGSECVCSNCGKTFSDANTEDSILDIFEIFSL